jgi:hypothetical protein
MANMWAAVAADILGITVLAYAIYYRRHFRRDLALAYTALNVGILSVTMLLATSSAGIGLGLGLFGILSIIRLRSDSITQEEVAYYFVSLAMGLVNGLHPGPVWLAPMLSMLLVLVMTVADHPRFARTTYRQTVTIDVAHANVDTLKTALEKLLGGRVLHLVVLELDIVRDLTVVDVRFRVEPAVDQPSDQLGIKMLGVRDESWAVTA